MSDQNANSPLISVVVPTYNRATTICRCIDNILEQDFDNFELIIVDDGSSDNTEEVLKPYMDRIVYFRKENGGVGSARDKGVELARGEWIAYQDSDDVWETDKLSYQAELVKRFPEADIISSNMIIYREQFGRDINWFEHIGIKPESGDASMLEDGFITHLQTRFAWLQASLIRRSKLLEGGGNDPELRIFVDLDLFLKTGLVSKWAISDKVVARILREDGDNNSISSRRKKHPGLASATMIRILERVKDLAADPARKAALSPFLSQYYNIQANHIYSSESHSEGAKLYWKAYKYQPRPALFMKAVAARLPFITIPVKQ